MADNLHPADGPVRALSDHAIVSFVGPDAAAFAHAQFANDVAALAVGQWQWNAWLTPKGRVMAVFALLRRDAETLWAVLPDHPAEVFVQQLQRFVFRRKLKIEVRADWVVTGVPSAPAAASGPRWAMQGDAIELDRGSPQGARHWRLTPVAGASGGIAVEAWRLHDIRDGLPRLDESQREQWTPQQLSLDRWQAFSVKKGCYPGQEIVARTHFLGKAKRGLRLLHAEAPLHAGAKVADAARDLGEVVSAASEGPDSWALAVMPLEEVAAAWHVDGIVVREVVLPDATTE